MKIELSEKGAVEDMASEIQTLRAENALMREALERLKRGDFMTGSSARVIAKEAIAALRGEWRK